jgi:[ribosomal protein S18]-alanine N-acetyltransferase
VRDQLDQIMAVMECAFDPAFGEAWTRSQVENALLMGNCRVILVNARGECPADDEPATGFSLIRSVAGEDELLLFAVDPKYRRQGIGAAMLTLLFQDARSRAIEAIHLEMRRDNPAERLYRAHGFVPVGIRPNYYRSSTGERIDAISFRCTP